MATDSQRAIIRRVAHEIWERGALDLIDQLYREDFIRHGPLGNLRGPGALKEYVSGLRAAFPDLRIVVEDEISAGPRLVVRWSMQGTQTGPLTDLAPTGNRIAVPGISILRFADGQIAEEWTCFDRLAMLEDLGVFPGPERLAG